MVDMIQEGKVVSLAYTLKLANGEIVDYSEVDEPLEYLHGANNIIPGLENALNGLEIGAKKDVEVSPEDGYGPYDPEDVQVVERKDLPKDITVQPGMVFAITDEEGNFSEAFVREISANNVTLDFNHPLAGQSLFFSVEVVGVRDATEEELEHGHPHGADFDEFEDEFMDDDDYDFDDDDEFEDDDELEDDEDYPNVN